MKNEIIRSLINPESFTRWLKPWSWYTSSWDEKESVSYVSLSLSLSLSLFLSLEVENDSLEKFMETLTPNGVFIGFTTRLKWLEPTKGLVT